MTSGDTGVPAIVPVAGSKSAQLGSEPVSDQLTEPFAPLTVGVYLKNALVEAGRLSGIAAISKTIGSSSGRTSIRKSREIALMPSIESRTWIEV